MKGLGNLGDSRIDKNVKYFLDLSEAIILKNSLRAKYRGKAEEILENLLNDEEIFNHEIYIDVCLNYFEILLTELEFINDEEILKLLNEKLVDLTEYAKIHNLFWFLSEIYILQANLALIELDYKKTQVLLLSSLIVCNEHNLDQICLIIPDQHKKIEKLFKNWSYLNIEKLSYSQRLKESGIKDLFVSVKNRQISHFFNKFNFEKKILGDINLNFVLGALNDSGIALLTKKFQSKFDNRKLEYMLEYGMVLHQFSNKNTLYGPLPQRNESGDDNNQWWHVLLYFFQLNDYNSQDVRIKNQKYGSPAILMIYYPNYEENFISMKKQNQEKTLNDLLIRKLNFCEIDDFFLENLNNEIIHSILN